MRCCQTSSSYQKIASVSARAEVIYRLFFYRCYYSKSLEQKRDTSDWGTSYFRHLLSVWTWSLTDVLLWAIRLASLCTVWWATSIQCRSYRLSIRASPLYPTTLSTLLEPSRLAAKSSCWSSLRWPSMSITRGASREKKRLCIPHRLLPSVH